MIFDQENIFIDNSLATTNIVANVGGGDAADPLFLVAVANTALTASGTVTLALVTSDTEAFTESTTLGTYTLATSKAGILAAVKVPYGAKEFLKVTISGSPSAGALTVGLTETVPNWNY